MDYVVGSVAALVTGNVTPNRPRLSKRALTPTKHQPSPNVTPKSEFVDDRSIFLSPSMQKKKAIVKKSPKRIFQNPDLETTDNGDGNLSLNSPKADKVKKHLKGELENDSGAIITTADSKSPKNKGKNKKESILPNERKKEESAVFNQSSNENSPKKKKKKHLSVSENPPTSTSESVVAEVNTSTGNSPKKLKQRRKSVIDDEGNKGNGDAKSERAPDVTNAVDKTPKKENNKLITSESTSVSQEVALNNVNNDTPKKKNRKRKKKPKQQVAVEAKLESTDNIAEETNKENIEIKEVTPKKKNKRRKKKAKQEKTETKSEATENIAEETKKENIESNQGTPKKKNRKRKKSTSQNKPVSTESEAPASDNEEDEETAQSSKKSKNIVNPNAITDKESDSEHESDDEIESENEEINKKVFESEPAADESSDENEEEEKTVDKPQKQNEDKKKEVPKENTEDEIKRTLFVGNVPFSAKCKKEIKKIFNKHGQIETIRIRTVPVKDGRYTPKLAVIKNELHPERTTVNVYIKYTEEESVEKALAENNTVLNDHHLRVSRSSHTGAEHDPKCSIFVGNLPFAMEDEHLREKFAKCGEIESVRIIRDKKTNAGKGFGYVNFASKDGVELALALTEEDLTIKNRIVRVKRCTQLTNKQKQTSDNKGGFKKQFNQRPNQGNQRVQGGQRPNQLNQRGNQGFQGGPRQGPKDEQRDGASRRIMHKRKFQEGSGGDGPPNKKQKNITQPSKEKKSRKEFVGMTAEKKKKRKFDKGQKKKKALSEILTK